MSGQHMQMTCSLTDPPRLMNGAVRPMKKQTISRDKAAGYLRACRSKNVSLLRLRPGNYVILPDGLDHGFRLITR